MFCINKKDTSFSKEESKAVPASSTGVAVGDGTDTEDGVVGANGEV